MGGVGGSHLGQPGAVGALRLHVGDVPAEVPELLHGRAEGHDPRAGVEALQLRGHVAGPALHGGGGGGRGGGCRGVEGGGRVTPRTPPPRRPAPPRRSRRAPQRAHAPPSPPAGQSPRGPHQPCLPIGGERLPVRTTALFPPHGGERHRFTPLPPLPPPAGASPFRRGGVRVPARRAHVSRASLVFAASALPSVQRPAAVSLRTTRPMSPAGRRRHRRRSPPPEPRPAAPARPLPLRRRPRLRRRSQSLPAPAPQPIGIRRPLGAGQRIRRPGAGRLLGGQAEGRGRSLGGGC